MADPTDPRRFTLEELCEVFGVPRSELDRLLAQDAKKATADFRRLSLRDAPLESYVVPGSLRIGGVPVGEYLAEAQAHADRAAFEQAAAGEDFPLRTDGADYYDHRASRAYAMFLAGCRHARGQA